MSDVSQTDWVTLTVNNECWMSTGNERVEIQRAKLMYRMLCFGGHRDGGNQNSGIMIAD